MSLFGLNNLYIPPVDFVPSTDMEYESANEEMYDSEYSTTESTDEETSDNETTDCYEVTDNEGNDLVYEPNEYFRKQTIFESFLENKFQEIYCKLNYIKEDKVSLIWGNPMSGKTDASIATLMYFNILKNICVFMVQDVSSISQLEFSVKTFNKNLQDWIARNGYNPEQFVITTKRIKDINKIENEENEENCIYICITNHIDQPRKCMKLLEENGSKYTLLFDESHKTMFTDSENELYEIKENLKLKSNKLIGTTATPFKNWADEDYPINSLIRLKPNNTMLIKYREFIDLDHKVIDELESREISEDQSLLDFVDYICSKPYLEKITYPVLPFDYIPRIGFISYSDKTIVQKEIADEVFKRSKNGIVITKNSKFYFLYTPLEYRNLIDKIIINDKEITLTSNITKIPEEIPISKLLQVFSCSKDDVKIYKNNVLSESPEKFPIFIVGSRGENQGVRINSSDFILSITDEFLRVPKTSQCDNDTQKVRIVGYRFMKNPNTPDLPTNLWCTQLEYDNLLKNHLLINATAEHIDEALTKKNLKKKLDSFEIYKNMEVNKSKVPTKKLAKKIAELCTIDDSFEDMLNYEIPEQQVVKSNNHKLDMNIIKTYMTWIKSKKDMKVFNVIKQLKINHTYSKNQINEILRNANSKLAVQHFMKQKIGKSNGHGRIIIENGKNSYIVNPILNDLHTKLLEKLI